MNLTELLATPVIDLTNATQTGVVSAFALGDDLKRVEAVTVIDEENYCREINYRLADVKWGEDCLLVDAPTITEELTRIPLRGQIYDVDGAGYGYLKEVVCDAKGRIEAWVTTDDVRIAPARVWKIGDLILLKGKKTYAKRKSAPVMGKTRKTAESEDGAPKESLRRVAGDYSFLLGRTVKSDLIKKGEVLLRQGSVIDEELIALAREKGVLVTLTELSR